MGLESSRSGRAFAVAIGFIAAANAAAAPPDLTGTWRIDLVATNMIDMPVAGKAKVRTEIAYIAQISTGPAGLEQSHEVCWIHAGATGPVRTTVPRAFAKAFPRKVYGVELREGDAGWQYTADFGTIHVGYDPALTNQQIPKNYRDPGVLDWEGDGKPGGTLRLTLGLFGEVELYTAQTSRSVLRGRVLPDGNIAGDLLVTGFSQRTIGASNRLFINNPDITPFHPESTFKMARVADSSTCDSIAGK